jgi:hypothetical protein
MAGVPDGITLKRHRDLAGRERQHYYRWALLCAVSVLPILGLLNVFGQHPTSTTVNAPAASLSVTAPSRLRGGLTFQVRAEVLAHREIHELELVFDRGWWESMGVNSIEPEPTDESSEGGRVVLSYGKLATGEQLVVWLNFQVNPTNVAKRRENVEIDDGPTTLAHVRRALTIFP